MDQDTVRAHLTGPVASIKMPFNQDGSVDDKGLRNFIDATIAGGSRAVILTAGDSHYNCLNDEEVAEVTKITCQHTAGRAMVVAADFHYSTPRAVAFARFLRDQGADIYMLLPPTWDRCAPQVLADHYVTVSRIMPVMAVTNVFENFDDTFALETLRLMLEQSDQIMAIKDDRGHPFVQDMCLQCHDRCAIFAGGSKLKHLSMLPFGCDGYMSLFVTFKPELAANYWKAASVLDFATAGKFISESEEPLRDYFMKRPGGWNSALHGMLELYGIAKRWRRKPYTTIDDAGMEELADFMRARNLL